VTVKIEDAHPSNLIRKNDFDSVKTPEPKEAKIERGKNTNTIKYDPVTGRPISAEGTIKEDFGSTKRGDNATEVGNIGGKDYDGGHLVGHRYLGDTPDSGIAPQVSNLNRSAYKKMENEWGDWVGKGYEVNYKIDVHPPGAEVPDSFRVEYTVKDPKTGEIVNDTKHKFKNKDGQTFNRVKKKDMPDRD